MNVKPSLSYLHEDSMGVRKEPERYPCGCRVGIEGCFSPDHSKEDVFALGATEMSAKDIGLLETIVQNPPAPNAALKAASRRFAEREAGACCSQGSILNPAPETAQQRFDAQYISSNEIAERLGVSRPAVLAARTRGVLPDPVCVNGGQIYVWERASVEPYLRAWEVSVKLRRGETVTIPLVPHPGAQEKFFSEPFNKDAHPFTQPLSDA